MFQTVSRGVILAVVMLLLGTVAQAQQLASVVMDARTGSVLKAVNADARVHPASLTKMMTLYIVFDELRAGRMSLDQKVTISSHAASEPPSRLGLRAGQKIELRYLIRAAAIKSANDAATALGEAVAGSEAAFAARMNAYARAMGMTKTTFKNANGLTRDGHLSTARDMATLGRRIVYDFPQYYNIFGRTSTSAGLSTVKNTNQRLLDAYPGADGIKTGYTKAAGFNVVSSAQRGNRRVIVAVLGERSTAQRNADASRLMDFGFSSMPSMVAVVPPSPLRTLVASTAPVAKTRVQPTVSEATPVIADASGTLTLTGRPLPRALDSVEISRNSASIAAAIAEVNSALASQATRSPAMAAEARPLPRPGVSAGIDETTVATIAGRASTFAVASAELPQRRVSMTDDDASLPTTSAGTTGGHEWGVQLGSYRAKGDAERQLLTTALMDVAELSGGLRRVEAARVQGVTVYRAQFVGLDQKSALAACASLARMEADCLPLAPGI